MQPRWIGIAFAAVLLVATPLLGWYWLSPNYALDRLAEFDAEPTDLLSRYDRTSVRQGFEAQMEPQVDDYPPPLTKSVVLDAISHPESVRMLVAEPFGEWQFAAAEGLPADIAQDDNAVGPMPRIMETTQAWNIERDGLSGFVASGADRKPSNRYRFRREGPRWVLDHIELTTRIR